MAFRIPPNLKPKCSEANGYCSSLRFQGKSSIAGVEKNSKPGIPPPPPPPPSPEPSPTPTPSITPPNTPTPSITPTMTVTPTMTNTPSPTPYGPPLTFLVETTFSVPSINLGFMDEGTYSGVIDWGDGSVLPMSSNADGIHMYAATGTYEVKVYGTIIGLQIGTLLQAQRTRFLEVKQWGTLQAYNNSFNLMFGYCSQLKLSGVTDVLNLQGVTATSFMFGSTNSDNNTLTTINRIDEWDVSSVMTFERMFSRINQFNGDVSSWNVSAATNMIGMFNGVDSFDRDISGWDVSNVTNMNFMFTDAFTFNQDLSSWCVSLIPTAPTSFDTGASSWVLPRPIWGTCP